MERVNRMIKVETPKEKAESTKKKEEWQWDKEKEVPRSSWSKQKWRDDKEEGGKEPPQSSWGKRKWQDETGKGDEDSAQPKWKKQSWRQDEEKIDDHHAGSSKGKWRDDKKEGHQEQSQASWGKQKWRPDEEDSRWYDDNSSWYDDNRSDNSSWYDDNRSTKKYAWSKNQYSGNDTSGGQVSRHSSPPPLVPTPSPPPLVPPPPPSPSVPPMPPSQDAATVRGSVGRFIQPAAALVIKKGETVLTRVGPARQPSSQASLPQNSSEQSRKQTIGLNRPSTIVSIRAEPETDTPELNRMLKHYQQNVYGKIPGGCTQPTSGMSSESARIVKVDCLGRL